MEFFYYYGKVVETVFKEVWRPKMKKYQFKHISIENTYRVNKRNINVLNMLIEI